MMDEQGTRVAVMMEDMDRKLGVLAESVQVVTAKLAELKDDCIRRFDHIDARFVGMSIEMRDLKTEVGTLGSKVDRLEVKVDRLEAFANDAGPRLERLEVKVDKLEGKVDKLEAFANDAGPRLVRIETHLALPALPPRQDKTRLAPSKPPRRKPLKRN